MTSEAESAPKTIRLTVPNVGDASEIELVSWYASEGEAVSKGQELCELVTDKAAFPLEAPTDGRLLRILKPEGSQVKIGEELLELELGSASV